MIFADRGGSGNGIAEQIANILEPQLGSEGADLAQALTLGITAEEFYGACGLDDSEPMSDEELTAVMQNAHENVQVNVLFYIWRRGLIDNGQLRRVFLHAWSAPNPAVAWEPPSLKDLLEISDAIGWLSDGLEKPTSNLSLYRGCREGQMDRPCWTRSREMAIEFAEKYYALAEDGEFVVYRAVVPPEACLFAVDARGEMEVVIDPRKVSEVEIVDRKRRETPGVHG